MPKSMRAQAAHHRRREKELAITKKRRADAAISFRQNKSLREVMETHSLQQTTAWRIRKAIKTNNDGELQKLLNPVDNRAGRETLLTKEEHRMNTERCVTVAAKGYAITNSQMRSIQARVSADGRKGFQNGIPSNDAVRSFRARTPGLTYRKAENKEAAKIKGENYEHVKTLARELQKVGQDHPGIFDDPDRVWNMDETKVDAQFGIRERTFVGKNSRRGGFQVGSKKSNKHITAVIAGSASGRVAPLFVIAAGKKLMKKWYEPLDSTIYRNSDGSAHWLARDGWLPGDTALRTSENGSMEQTTMPFFVEHLGRYVRKFVPDDKSWVLLLDGHSSRLDFEWVKQCAKRNIVPVILPANTSHFLQPCDQKINKSFQTAVRKVRDELLKCGRVNTGSISFKLKVAIAAHRMITAQHVKDSFAATGLWPMDYRFINALRTKADAEKENVLERIRGFEDAEVSARLPSVKRRRSDAEAAATFTKIVKRYRQEPSRMIHNLAIELFRRETVNSILMSAKPAPSIHNSDEQKNVALMCGAPAKYMTIADVLNAHEQEIERKASEEKRKEENKLRKKEERDERERQKGIARARKQKDREEKVKKAAEKKTQAASLRAEKNRERDARKAVKASTTSRPSKAGCVGSPSHEGRAAAVDRDVAGVMVELSKAKKC